MKLAGCADEFIRSSHRSEGEQFHSHPISFVPATNTLTILTKQKYLPPSCLVIANILLALKELILLSVFILLPHVNSSARRWETSGEVGTGQRGQPSCTRSGPAGPGPDHHGVPLALLQQLLDQHPHRPGV